MDLKTNKKNKMQSQIKKQEGKTDLLLATVKVEEGEFKILLLLIIL